MPFVKSFINLWTTSPERRWIVWPNNIIHFSTGKTQTNNTMNKPIEEKIKELSKKLSDYILRINELPPNEVIEMEKTFEKLIELLNVKDKDLLG